jgi:hypothetical protein
MMLTKKGEAGAPSANAAPSRQNDDRGRPQMGRDAPAAAKFVEKKVDPKRAVELPTAQAPSDTKSKLVKTIEDKESVADKVLKKDIAKYIKSEEDRAELIDCLAKSVFVKVLMLADMVATLQEKVPEEVSPIVVGVLQFLKDKKGEVLLNKILVHSKLDVVAVIADKLEDEALDAFLIEKDLLCLKPVPDLSVDIKKALSAGSTPTDVLKLINDKIDDKLSAAVMASAVADALGAAIFKATPPAIELIKEWSPLLKRVLCTVKEDVAAQVEALIALQTAWNTAKLPKAVIKPIFEAMHEHVGIGHEGFTAWKVDTSKVSPGKMKALLQVNSWVESIVPVVAVEGEEDEEEESDLEDYGQ